MKVISVKEKLPDFNKMVLLVDSETNAPKFAIDCGYLESVDKDGPNFVQNLGTGDMFSIFSGAKNTVRRFKVTHWKELDIEL